MGDIIYTLQDIGWFPVICSGIVIFLFITAFTHGGKGNGGSSGGGGSSTPPTPPAAPPTPPAPPAS